MVMMEHFDAEQVEPSKFFSAIPAGKYDATIIESEEKSNKKGTGRYLQLTFEILSGDFEGRRVWARLNLTHPNPTVVRIARAELSAICRAVGVMQFNDSEQLHNLPLVIHVKTKQRTDADEPANEIKGYTAFVWPNVPALVSPGAPPQAPATPPWRR